MPEESHSQPFRSGSPDPKLGSPPVNESTQHPDVTNALVAGSFCGFGDGTDPDPAGFTRVRAYTPDPDGRYTSRLTYASSGSLAGVTAFDRIVDDAFAAWSFAAGGKPELVRVTIDQQPDMTIGVGALAWDNHEKRLGTTSSDRHQVVFQNRSDVQWTDKMFQGVALHEFGHALGLLHSTDRSAVMYPIAGSPRTAMADDDRSAIRAIYGWSTQRRIDGVGTGASPALAACGSQLAVAWRGAGDDQNIWFSVSSDGVHWRAQERVPLAATSSHPSLAWDGTRLWMAWKGIDGDAGIYQCSTNNLITWNEVWKIADAGTSSGPSLASADGQLILAWKGAGDDSGLYWARTLSAPGTAWSPHNIGGTGSTDGPGLVIQGDGTPRLVWRGAGGDDRVYTSTLSDMFWQPQQLVEWVVPGNGSEGTATASYPRSACGPALATRASKVFMAWRGSGADEGLWFTQFAPIPDGHWSGQANVALTGTSTGPALAVWDDHLWMAWKGAGGDAAIYTSSLELDSAVMTRHPGSAERSQADNPALNSRIGSGDRSHASDDLTHRFGKDRPDR